MNDEAIGEPLERPVKPLLGRLARLAAANHPVRMMRSDRVTFIVIEG
jgi:hypothetical protein